jgi:hypothetical protein
VPQTRTPRSAALEVDGRVAHPGGDQEAEAGQAREERARERRPLPHGHHEVDVGQPRGDRVRVAEDHHFHAGGEAPPVRHAAGHVLGIVEDRETHDGRQRRGRRPRPASPTAPPASASLTNPDAARQWVSRSGGVSRKAIEPSAHGRRSS